MKKLFRFILLLLTLFISNGTYCQYNPLDLSFGLNGKLIIPIDIGNDAATTIIAKYKLENNVYIESQSIEFLNLFKSKMPESKLFIYMQFKPGLEAALQHKYAGITISTRDISKEQIKMMVDQLESTQK